jgi:parallel beta-helix repeat protein
VRVPILMREPQSLRLGKNTLCGKLFQELAEPNLENSHKLDGPSTTSAPRVGSPCGKSKWIGQVPASRVGHRMRPARVIALVLLGGVSALAQTSVFKDRVETNTGTVAPCYAAASETPCSPRVATEAAGSNDSFNLTITPEIYKISITRADITGHEHTETISPDPYDINNVVFVAGMKYPTIAAAVAAIPVGGATVYVQPGTYALSGTVTLPSNSRLYCSDTAIITQANAQGLLTFISLGGSTNSSVENCTVDGDRSGNTDGTNQVLVMLSGSTNATVKGNRIRNGNNTGVYTGTATNPTIQNNQFSNFWSDALEVGFTGTTVATNGTIKNNTFTTQGSLGLQFSDGNVISGNKITGYAQASNVTTSGTSVTWVSGATFTNLSPGMYLTINLGQEHQITSVNSSTSLTLLDSAGTNTNTLAYLGSPDLLNLDSSSNNVVTGNVVNVGMGYGIVVHQNSDGAESSLHNVVSSNTISKTGGTCIGLNSNADSPTVSGTLIKGNTISDCGQAGIAKGTTNNREGIELTGAGGIHYTMIVGNDIYDDQGSATTLHGILINAGITTDQFIGPNTIIGMVTAPIGGGATPNHFLRIWSVPEYRPGKVGLTLCRE